MGSGGGFDRREAGSSTRGPAQRENAGVPGKVTRTSRLPRRPAGSLPAPFVQAQRDGRVAGPAVDGGVDGGSENAVMQVRALGADGAVLAEWRGAAFFYGELPVRYQGHGWPPRWDDAHAESIKIDSDAAGASGKTLAQWAPRGTRRIVVTIVARGAGQSADLDVADEGTAAPGAGTREPGKAARSGWDDVFDAMAGAPAGHAPPGQEQEQGQGQDGTGEGHAGARAGGERGARGGHARGREAASWVAGGAPDVDGGRIGDPEHGRPWGRAGGEAGAEGHIDGPGIVGVLDVPEDVAPLVNAAALVADANLAGFGHKLLGQALEGVAERVLRQQIVQEARRVARAGLPRVARRIDELEKYRRLPPAGRKALLDRAEAAMEGACRKRIAQHAAARAEENERVVAQLAGKTDDRSEHLRRIAGENAAGYRRVEAAAGGNGRAEAPAGNGPAGAVAPAAGQDASRLVYEVNPKHTAVRRGAISAAPRDGQRALARSVPIKETSTRRVGVDPANGEIVVFDEHLPGRFHGHVRSWNELTPPMQHALEQAGLVGRRGRIIEE